MFKRLLATGLCATLISCGGGGGSGGESAPDQPTNPEVSAPTTDVGRVSSQMATTVLTPLYQQLANAFGAFNGAAQVFCGEQSTESLQAVRGAWRGAMDAYMTIFTMQLGPIGRNNGDKRIQFFPDDNNNVNRSVQRVLAGSEPLTAATITNQSFAAQGLPAAETLLFPGDALAQFAAQPRRCEFLQAIGGNLVNLGNSINGEWVGGFVNQFAAIGVEGSRFATEQVYIEEMVNEFADMASLIRIQKLANPLGTDASSAQTSLFESPISQTSAQNIVANLNGLRDLFTGGAGFGFDDLLVARGEGDLSNQIITQIDAVRGQAGALSSSLLSASTGPNRGEAERLRDLARDLSILFNLNLASTFRVEISFNETDGD